MEQIQTYIREMDNTRLFSLLSIVLIFVFYCIPKSKRSVYLLPIYPFIAYFLAEYIMYLAGRHSKAIKVYGGFLSVAGILLLATFITIQLGLIPDTIFHGRHAAENIAFLNALKNISLNAAHILVICLPLLGAIYFFRAIRKKAPDMKLVYATLFVTFSIFMSLDGAYQPAILNTKSDKGMATEIQKIASGSKIYSYVAVDMLRFYTVNFYHNDRIGLFEKEMPSEGYLLVGRHDFESFKPKYESRYSFEEVYQSPKRGCDIRDIIYLYRFKEKE